MVHYNEKKKDLPSDQLHQLFRAVGWSDGSETEDQRIHFNGPFLKSTRVISAWEGTRLIGAARVLSDEMVRAVLYDFVVAPDFQNKGIGKEMLKRCIQQFPHAEWLVQTRDAAGFYEKHGFALSSDVFLTRPSKYF